MKQLAANPTEHWVRPILREEAGHKTVHLGTNTHAPLIHAGKTRVQWPDGTEEEVVITLKKERVESRVMGEKYPIINTVPYITVNYNGAKLDVELVKSNVKVWKDN